MDTTPLGLFATKARSSNRLLYGDLRRLRRDVLPTGARSREEIEVLLSLDWIERVDRDWPRYLAMTVSEFVLSTADPPGVIDGDTAAWLAAALAETRPKTAAVVLRSIMSEAHQVDEALVAFVRQGAKPRYGEPRPAEHRTGFLPQESATSSEASGDPAQDTLTIA
jgi:hypothetical protein